MYYLNFIELAEIALHRCVNSKKNENGDREINDVNHWFEFLDDFDTAKPRLIKFISDVFNMTSTSSSDIPMDTFAVSNPRTERLICEGGTREDVTSKYKDERRWMQKRFTLQNHPLELMVCSYQIIIKIILLYLIYIYIYIYISYAKTPLV